MSRLFGFIGFLFSLVWAQSVRGRSIRLSILILGLLALAFAALSFRNVDIDIPGLPQLKREGTGPLGLKLGLDLRGGGQLIYQADTGTSFDLSFQDPITQGSLGETLGDLRFGEEGLPLEKFTLEPRGPFRVQIVQISTELLDEDDPRVSKFQESVEAKLGTIASLRVFNTDTITRFDVAFLDPILPQEVTDALGGVVFGEEELVLENPTVNNSLGFASFLMKTGVLEDGDPRRTSFQETVVAKLGTITSLGIDTIELPDSDQMDGALDIINRRVNLYGTDEPIIQRFGDDRIIVQLPGASGSVTEVRFLEPVPEAADAETLRSVFVAAGFDDVEIDRQDDRSFRIKSATVNAAKREAAQEALVESLGVIQGFQVSSAIDDAKDLIGQTAQLVFKERTCIDLSCSQFADADIGLTGEDLSRAFARIDSVGIGWEVVINFDGRGTEIFSDLTRRISGQQDTKRIAIFLDDDEILAPVALAHIRDGVTRITGNFNREEAQTFAIQVDAGRLPVPLKLIQENDVSALLGSESLRNSLIAGIIGLALVMAYMVAYYRMAGVVASLALVFYAVVELAIFKLVPITLTLSHIGGFILSIGMAVDANVLIFERMKEEIRIGRTLASSMEVGFNRAWPAIRDGNFSTLITCGVLLWFGDRLGGGLVTGFAISLGIGVLLSMFTAVVLSRNLLQLLAWAGFRNRIGLFTPEGVHRTAPIPGRGA
jgi:preprotein translocase subunit SecD